MGCEGLRLVYNRKNYITKVKKTINKKKPVEIYQQHSVERRMLPFLEQAATKLLEISHMVTKQFYH